MTQPDPSDAHTAPPASGGQLLQYAQTAVERPPIFKLVLGLLYAIFLLLFGLLWTVGGTLLIFVANAKEEGWRWFALLIAAFGGVCLVAGILQLGGFFRHIRGAHARSKFF